MSDLRKSAEVPWMRVARDSNRRHEGKMSKYPNYPAAVSAIVKRCYTNSLIKLTRG